MTATISVPAFASPTSGAVGTTFKARLRNTTTGGVSLYSSPATVAVS